LIDTTVTDADGRFVFDALPRGYALSVSKANFIGRDIDIEFDGQQFTLDGQPLDDPVQTIALTRSPQSDRDADGVIDVLDNCPDVFDPDLSDIDEDGLGDVCDNDADGDGMVNGLDNCPFSFNPMQEDTDGLGRGTVCSSGSLEQPIRVGCGIHRQLIDTRERADLVQGSCGGAGSPEVIYRLGVGQGEQWDIRVEGAFPPAVYLLDAQNREVFCAPGGRATIGRDELSQGQYKLVIDGFGSGDSGAASVSIGSPQACAPSFAPQQRFGTAENPTEIARADLDGDGLDDIVTANKNSDNVSVLLSAGGGSLEAHETYATERDPVSVALGDVNHDGKIDIVTANDTIGTGLDTVSVLLGAGNGTFSEHRDFRVGASPSSVALADLNGDGFLDIVAVNSGANSVSALLGVGDGSFSEFQGFAVGTVPSSVALTDVNGDDLVDVVTANRLFDTVSLSLGSGDGTFLPPRDLPVGRAPSSVAFADVNDDGLVDIITTNQSDGTVSMLLSLGDGSFDTRREASVGRGPSSVALADINDDGLIDIVTANRTDASVSVLLGAGDSSFETQKTFSVGNAPSSVVLADLNGDRFIDIATANASGNDTSVLLGVGDGYFEPHQTFKVGDQPESVALAD
ncbi:MAG: VCBS repeat-containing protein, partial [Phycisphaerales bacterium]|nr:VCBS repeat-containing protein [Phycisphaerales bacterium]